MRFIDIHRSLTWTGPTIEPISEPAAKLHLRETTNEQDTRIKEIIAAARRQLCEETQRAIATTTYPLTGTLKLDRFPSDEILLELPPILAVSSIVYIDTTGTQQTWASSNYLVDTNSEPGRVTLAHGKSWPTAQARANAVTVTFTAGYSPLDQRAVQALYLLIGHMWEHREAAADALIKDVPLAYQHLVRSLQWGDYR